MNALHPVHRLRYLGQLVIFGDVPVHGIAEIVHVGDLLKVKAVAAAVLDAAVLCCDAAVERVDHAGGHTVAQDLRQMGDIGRQFTAEQHIHDAAVHAPPVVDGTALGSLMVLLREIDFAGVIFSTAFYLLCMCCLQCASLLHLPALMDPNRCSIFLCYSVCFSWTLGADAIVHLLIRWWKKRWVSNVASILTLVIAVSAVISNGLLRKPIVVDALEDNGAIACVTNILKENRNFTWTICSADDELRMTEFYGYHYETITFLRELQDLEKNPEIIMPTQNVYFFVEKIPIDYAGSTNHKEVTVEGAEAPLPSAGGIEPYFAENRWYTMCHIYYWTQKFKELYPDEMEVYYETDSFICYRVQQNVNSPYNFAIDYGYNNPTPKAGSEEE